jgi:hypothetical protein
MPPLKYDKRLESGALQYACDRVSKVKSGAEKIGHSDSRTAEGFSGLLGENLAFDVGSATERDAAKTPWVFRHAEQVSRFGGEERNFDLVNMKPKGTGEYRHFTQSIWRSTKVVGCGFAVVETRFIRSAVKGVKWRAIWVFRYHPEGNDESKFAENLSADFHGAVLS